jgi:conjugative relaxase-like TrwC/TraI family protein
MISMRRISLGGGFRYLMEFVARGDGAPNPSAGLAAYYAASGTPPGRFLGSGLPDLDGGKGVKTGTVVTEGHLRNMLGACCDPVSDRPVGRIPNAGARVPPVAGFDLTFSPSKSVSTVWALADEATKGIIYHCHLQAIAYVLEYAERHVLHSRSGTNGVMEEDITGAIAAAFTHWDSRAGDPQLHDHLIVWNRAKSVSDGKWRTLDSRGLYKARSALSAMHQGVLSDYLTRALGVGWEGRARRHSAQPRWEITGVPEALLLEFSQRVAAVERETDRLMADFRRAHGRSPTGVETLRLRQQATLATRPAKTHRSLEQMTASWRERAAKVIADDPVAWVSTLRDRNHLPLLRAHDLAEPMLADAAQAVVNSVAERRATFSRSNLLDDAHRLLHGVRFADPDERVVTAERIADIAVEQSLKLTPPSLHHTPGRYTRPDGSCRLQPQSHHVYTSHTLLEAESRLLQAGREQGAPTVPAGPVAAVTDGPLHGRPITLSADQALAIAQIASSGRWLDVLVGPAGTGKSTTMAGLRAAWEATHGPGSVLGLAPSAGAAEVLADEIGVDTDNTAKWLTEWRRLPQMVAARDHLAAQLARHPYPGSTSATRMRCRLQDVDAAISVRRLHADQLVIVDEASLAGTLDLDELTSAARNTGAKVLLTGDWAQLSAVNAGGAFHLLASDREEAVPELTDVRRFIADWEKQASVQLRLGQETAIGAYHSRGRIIEGNRDELVDRIYQGWKADTDAGLASIMVAADTATVAELNRRARRDRVAVGHVTAEGLHVVGGQSAGVGDEVITRQNDRTLANGRGWVKNGDRWTVTRTWDDGRMTVRRAHGTSELTLPARYVAEHVELAYASTAHRIQGRTTDTAHALISPTTSREVLYVAASRGRASNRLYVDVSYDPDPQTGHDGTCKPEAARDVLAAVLANEGAELSAHETIRRACQLAESWTTLHAEYQTLARVAQADRWNARLAQAGLTEAEQLQARTSEAFGPLAAALQGAEARGLPVESALPRLVRGRTFEDADDVAAVLHGRVRRWLQSADSPRTRAAHLIAGLVPRATNISDPDMARGLWERDQAMERRARTLAEHAISAAQPWTRSLGLPPGHSGRHELWLRAVSTVAAYRDRWNIGQDRRPLGTEATSSEQLGHRRRALAALERARTISAWDQHPPGGARSANLAHAVTFQSQGPEL